MVRGGGGEGGRFPVFLGNEKNFYCDRIFSCSLILGTSVHEKILQIRPTILPLKLNKRRVLGEGVGVATTPHGLFDLFFQP